MDITKLKKNRIIVFLLENRHLIVLSFVLLVFSFQFFHFIFHNTVIPIGDDIAHGAVAARIFRIFLGQREFALLHRLSFPPLVYLISCIFFGITGFSPLSALLSIYIFCLLFLISLYLLGERLGGAAGGIASLLLGLSSPYFIYFGERYFLDLPGAAMCLLCIYILLRTEGFNIKRESLLLGVTIGLAQLTKWNCAVFFVPPVLAVLFWKCMKSLKAAVIVIISLMISAIAAYYYYILGTDSIKAEDNTGNITILHYVIFMSVFVVGIIVLLLLSKNIQKRDDSPEKQALLSSINGSLSAFTGQLLVYPVYLFCIKAYFIHFLHQKKIIGTFNLTFEPLSFFFALTWNYPFALLLTTVGLVFVFFHKEKFLDLSLIIIAMAAGYILTVKTSSLDYRYYLTVYGLMAVMGGYWARSLRKFAWVYVFIISLIPIAVFSNYFTGIPHLPIVRGSPPLVKEITPGNILRPIPFGIMKPDKGNYHLKELIGCISDDYREKYRSKSSPDHIVIEQVITEAFEKFSQENGLPRIRHDALPFAMEYYRSRDDRFYSSLRENPEETLRRVELPVYIIVYYVNPEEIYEMMDVLKTFSGRNFRQLCSYPLPGERKASVILAEP